MPRKRFVKKNKPRKLLIGIIFILAVANIFIFTSIANSYFNKDVNAESSTGSKADPQKEAQKIIYECQNLHAKESCYSDKFKKLTEKTDMSFAKQVLSKVQDVDPKQTLGCHLIAHYISIAETKKDPSKWKELLSEIDSNSCTGGYVHGILEAHMATNPDYKITATQIPVICSYLPDANAGGDINCSHNLGHILLAQEQDDIKKSVEICNQVEDSKMKYECLSGIFMERMTRLNLEAHGISKRISWDEKNTAEMEKICREHTGIAGLTCWREIVHMFSVLNNNEPQGVYDACYSAPQEEYAKDCYLHGTSIMAVSYDFKQENLDKICSFYNEDAPAYNKCSSYLLGGMLMSSAKFSNQVIGYCNSSPDEHKASCFGVMGNVLNGAVKSLPEREKICSSAPVEYKENCLKGNQNLYVQ